MSVRSTFFDTWCACRTSDLQGPEIMLLDEVLLY